MSTETERELIRLLGEANRRIAALEAGKREALMGVRDHQHGRVPPRGLPEGATEEQVAPGLLYWSGAWAKRPSWAPHDAILQDAKALMWPSEPE